MFNKFALIGGAVLLALGGCQSRPAATAPTPAPVVAAPAAAPAPAWQQGRTIAQATSPLAPVAGKLTVTPAADIQLNRLKLPPGFKIELCLPAPLACAPWSRGASGKVYAGTRPLGRVYEITDKAASAAAAWW